MPIIKTSQELNKIIQQHLIKAMKLTRDEIFDIVSKKVAEYYNEYNPTVYIRTGKLMESLTASNIQVIGNSFSFTVGFDDDYLVFTYPGNKNESYAPHINPATGLDVLEWFNGKSHGGLMRFQHKFWKESIEELEKKYGSITNLFRINCKKIGIPIK